MILKIGDVKLIQDKDMIRASCLLQWEDDAKTKILEEKTIVAEVNAGNPDAKPILSDLLKIAGLLAKNEVGIQEISKAFISEVDLTSQLKIDLEDKKGV